MIALQSPPINQGFSIENLHLKKNLESLSQMDFISQKAIIRDLIEQEASMYDEAEFIIRLLRCYDLVDFEIMVNERSRYSLEEYRDDPRHNILWELAVAIFIQLPIIKEKHLLNGDPIWKWASIYLITHSFKDFKRVVLEELEKHEYGYDFNILLADNLTTLWGVFPNKYFVKLSYKKSYQFVPCDISIIHKDEVINFINSLYGEYRKRIKLDKERKLKSIIICLDYLSEYGVLTTPKETYNRIFEDAFIDTDEEQSKRFFFTEGLTWSKDFNCRQLMRMIIKWHECIGLKNAVNPEGAETLSKLLGFDKRQEIDKSTVFKRLASKQELKNKTSYDVDFKVMFSKASLREKK